MKNVSKVLATGFIIAWAGFYPQPTGHTQPNSIVAPKQATDSLQVLQEQAREEVEKKRRSDSAALSISRELPALVGKLNKSVNSRRSKSIHDSKVSENVPLISFEGGIYEVPYRKYRGYLVIDVDSFISAVNKPDTISPMIHMPAGDLKPNDAGILKVWRKVKGLFSKPFKKSLQ